jgi:hypothetical protein
MTIAFNIIARIIAEKANKCCNRSDGFMEEIEVEILLALKESWNEAIEAAALIADEADEIAAQLIRKLKK